MVLALFFLDVCHVRECVRNTFEGPVHSSITFICIARMIFGISLVGSCAPDAMPRSLFHFDRFLCFVASPSLARHHVRQSCAMHKSEY